MNEIEVGRLLTAAKVLDPKMPQPDSEGFVLRLWTQALHDIPAHAAQAALQEYYRSARYRETRDPISPADIVQRYRDQRRYTSDEREPPPIVPERIHAGVQQVIAALAEKKAHTHGQEPQEAVTSAQAKNAQRRTYLSRNCQHCGAAPGHACTDHRGHPLKKSPAHDCRVRAIQDPLTHRSDAATAKAQLAQQASTSPHQQPEHSP